MIEFNNGTAAPADWTGPESYALHPEMSAYPLTTVPGATVTIEMALPGATEFTLTLQADGTQFQVITGVPDQPLHRVTFTVPSDARHYVIGTLTTPQGAFLRQPISVKSAIASSECTTLQTVTASGDSDPVDTVCSSFVYHPVATITNTTGLTIDVYFYGGVDDDLVVNGSVIQPNAFPNSSPDTFGTCNGAHGWDADHPVLILSSLTPGGTFTVGVNNNIANTWSINGTLCWRTTVAPVTFVDHVRVTVSGAVSQQFICLPTSLPTPVVPASPNPTCVEPPDPNAPNNLTPTDVITTIEGYLRSGQDLDLTRRIAYAPYTGGGGGGGSVCPPADASLTLTITEQPSWCLGQCSPYGPYSYKYNSIGSLPAPSALPPANPGEWGYLELVGGLSPDTVDAAVTTYTSPPSSDCSSSGDAVVDHVVNVNWYVTCADGVWSVMGQLILDAAAAATTNFFYADGTGDLPKNTDIPNQLTSCPGSTNSQSGYGGKVKINWT